MRFGGQQVEIRLAGKNAIAKDRLIVIKQVVSGVPGLIDVEEHCSATSEELDHSKPFFSSPTCLGSGFVQDNGGGT